MFLYSRWTPLPTTPSLTFQPPATHRSLSPSPSQGRGEGGGVLRIWGVLDNCTQFWSRSLIFAMAHENLHLGGGSFRKRERREKRVFMKHLRPGETTRNGGGYRPTLPLPALPCGVPLLPNLFKEKLKSNRRQVTKPWIQERELILIVWGQVIQFEIVRQKKKKKPNYNSLNQ